jgi:hypothetical protein
MVDGAWRDRTGRSRESGRGEVSVMGYRVGDSVLTRRPLGVARAGDPPPHLALTTLM